MFLQETTQEETAMVPMPRRRLPQSKGFPPREISARHTLRELEPADSQGLRGSELERGQPESDGLSQGVVRMGLEAYLKLSHPVLLKCVREPEKQSATIILSPILRGSTFWYHFQDWIRP